MKRERFLWPLTQSHHRALLATRKIKDRLSAMGPKNDDTFLRELSGEVKELFEAELGQHFWDEERILGLFEGRIGKDDPDVERIRKEHHLLETLFSQGGLKSLVSFADTLPAHIRFEEDILFPRFEKVLTAEDKKAVEEILTPHSRNVEV